MINYAGPGTPLSQNGLTSFCTATNTGAPELWAVLAVETSGCGFLPDRRPKILFERHWFHQFTAGQYDISHPDISQPTPGGYGAAGANQYSRLAEATVLDQDAALKSTSWGLPQIMGFNFNLAGFTDVSKMVTDMVASEDNQLSAMANFLLATGLATSLLT